MAKGETDDNTWEFIGWFPKFVDRLLVKQSFCLDFKWLRFYGMYTSENLSHCPVTKNAGFIHISGYDLWFVYGESSPFMAARFRLISEILYNI